MRIAFGRICFAQLSSTKSFGADPRLQQLELELSSFILRLQSVFSHPIV
jgi:hypothetical protein